MGLTKVGPIFYLWQSGFATKARRLKEPQRVKWLMEIKRSGNSIGTKFQ